MRAFTVGPVQENSYIVRAGADATRAVIVDPGDEAERLLAAIDSLGVEIEAILITHCHFDHIGAVEPLARATGAPVYCPEIERPVLADVMSWVPSGVRAVRELRGRAHGRGRRAPEPRRPGARRDLHPRAQPRPRHLRSPIARPPCAAVGRRALPGLRRARRSARRGLAHAGALDREPGPGVSAATPSSTRGTWASPRSGASSTATPSSASCVCVCRVRRAPSARPPIRRQPEVERRQDQSATRHLRRAR